MNFNGTIIITDPCYIATGSDWYDSKKFYYDDWALRKINVPEITTYFWNKTEKEDGLWEVVELNKITNRVESEKFIADYYNAVNSFIKFQGVQEKRNLEAVFNKQHNLGRFSIDSGSFGVFYLDEVLRYNPEFLKGHGIWLYTIIENFIGDISLYYYPSDSKDFHLIGLGNRTFITL